MTDLDIPTLKAAALAATPGPWMRIVKGEQFPMVAITGPNLRIGSKTATYSRPMGDMEFIALANPATVLALIERLEKLEAVAKAASQLLKYQNTGGSNRLGALWNAMAKDIAALEAP